MVIYKPYKFNFATYRAFDKQSEVEKSKMEKEVKMTTITEGFEPYTTTDALYIYKWLAETMIYKHKGSKDVTRIKYQEKYDGYIHATYYISNGTKVEITIPRS